MQVWRGDGKIRSDQFRRQSVVFHVDDASHTRLFAIRLEAGRSGVAEERRIHQRALSVVVIVATEDCNQIMERRELRPVRVGHRLTDRTAHQPCAIRVLQKWYVGEENRSICK